MPGNKYDTALAVLAYRMMYFETHPTAECYRLIWQPIDGCLQALARDQPPYLTCLHSRSYTDAMNEDPQQIDIHVVGSEQQLFLLGTASTRAAAIADWWDQLSALEQGTGSPPAHLAWGGAGALRRDFCGSIIPIDTDELTNEQLEIAARRILNRFSGLERTPIQWLDDAAALSLYTYLYAEAEHTARPPSEEEKWQIIRREYGES